MHPFWNVANLGHDAERELHLATVWLINMLGAGSVPVKLSLQSSTHLPFRIAAHHLSPCVFPIQWGVVLNCAHAGGRVICRRFNIASRRSTSERDFLITHFPNIYRRFTARRCVGHPYAFHRSPPKFFLVANAFEEWLSAFVVVLLLIVAGTIKTEPSPPSRRGRIAFEEGLFSSSGHSRRLRDHRGPPTGEPQRQPPSTRCAAAERGCHARQGEDRHRHPNGGHYR
mmetsp:Transcript_48197/g.145602  ORF Transcript_48197/g.145602 Transcript_48197/m.145602 type:complete len:227 (+) Transcript_48197:283-963(+)